jgi:ABC-type sugar transport system permease subunit
MKIPILKISVYVLIVSILIFNLPFILNVSSIGDIESFLKYENEGLGSALLRTISFALIQGFLLIGFGIFFSVLLIHVRLNSWIGIGISILLIPVIFGNLSTAFVWKIILLNNTYFFSSSYAKFLALSMINFWQYGTFFIYLYWLNIQSIPQKKWEYSQSNNLNPLEKLRDIILPNQRNLSIILFIIAFIFSFYEDAKLSFIFKASRGTNTELINQWLNRIYHSDLLSGADIAFQRLSHVSILSLIISIISIGAGIFLLNWIFKIISKKRIHLRNIYFSISSPISFITAFFLIIGTLFPLVFVIFNQSANFDFTPSILVYPLLLTSIAALLTTIIGIAFGVFCRFVWQKTLSDFNRNSMILIIALFFILLLPPIGILLNGFQWMELIGYSSIIEINIAWTLGHLILSFPYIAGFSIITHFRVKENYIDYTNSIKCNLREKVRDLFFRPFIADYILMFIIAFSIIWNEPIINSVLSDFIPSFVTELKRTIIGKSTNYSQGMDFFLVSLILSATCVILWSYIIKKSFNKEKDS